MASLLELVNPGPRFFSKPSTNSSVSKEEPQSVPVLTPAKPEYGTGILERELEGYQKQLAPRIQESQDLSVRMADALSKQAEGAALKEQNEAKQTAIKERNLGTAVRKIWENIERSPDYQETEKLNKEYADKSVFVPSETTAPLLGVVFATIGATGMMLGGLSKGNAKAALSAMNGMAEGFTKGREDLFKKEKAVFDENLKGLQNRLTFLKSKLELAQKKAATDAEAAAHDANAAFAEANAEFLKTHNDKFGLSDTIKQLNLMYSKNESMIKLIDQKKDAISAKLNKAYSDQRHDEIMAATKNQDWVNRFLLEESRQKGLGERAGELSQVRREIAEMQQQGLTPVGMQGNNLVMVDRQGNKKLIPMEEGFNPKGGLQPRPEPKPTTPRVGSQGGSMVQYSPGSLPQADTNLPIAPASAAGKGEGGKPPPKEILMQVNSRDALIPSLKELLPILERLDREGQYNKFAIALNSPTTAEWVFKGDLDAIKAIRILAKFRGGEFETAGKALTKIEDKILSPLYQAANRPYVAVKNAVEEGIKELTQQNQKYKSAYPGFYSTPTSNRSIEQKMDERGAVEGPSEADIRSKAQEKILEINKRTDINQAQKQELVGKIGSLYKQKTGMDL
jgi:hypothetical protein